MASVPITVYNNNDIRDDSDYGGCPSILFVDNHRIDDPQIWEPYNEQRNQTQFAIAASLNLTVEEVMEADFHTFEHYTDTDECLDFEGSEHVHQDYFTDEEWLLTREF